MKYTLFECMDCKQKVVYPQRTADGHRCNHCKLKGILRSIDTGTKEELRNKYNETIIYPRSK